MKNRKIAMLIVALVFGLGWAIRGSFGHEWGAAWAGGIGGMAIVGFSNRKDWLRRAPVLALLAAIGWGIGGMMSYGMVVGYCKGIDFVNVSYGYTMLVVIGGLYGFLGGGLFGLGLESTEEKPIDWSRLITEMFVGGFLFWGFFVFQLEWFMTPPRSELWAGCAGAAIGLMWFMQRGGYYKSLRVALFSALGAGIGFSFGNFMQVLGIKLGVDYNMWNVMEFTLGLLGGLGMAYAVYTTKWPQSSKDSDKANWATIFTLLVGIPLINYFEQFGIEKLMKSASNSNLSNPESVANQQFLFATLVILIFGMGGLLFWKKYKSYLNLSESKFIPIAVFGSALYYTLFGLIKNRTYLNLADFSESTNSYIPILIICYLLWHFKLRKKDMEFEINRVSESNKYWLGTVVIIILGIVIVTFLSIHLFEVQLEAPTRF